VKLAHEEHTSRSWLIHELAGDFRVEDVWALPTPGGRHDFERLVEVVGSLDPLRTSSPIVNALFAVRSKLGEVLGLDDATEGAGARVPALRDRLPAALRTTEPRAVLPPPFTSLYLLDDEFAAEAANRTMHGVIHLGWVPDGSGGYRGQLAILVKPNGVLGELYMAAIKPFRYVIVYPHLGREIERAWRKRAREREEVVTNAR
jgi:hypothetical protein